MQITQHGSQGAKENRIIKFATVSEPVIRSEANLVFPANTLTYTQSGNHCGDRTADIGETGYDCHTFYMLIIIKIYMQYFIIL